MKKLAIALLVFAYLPMFFLKGYELYMGVDLVLLQESYNGAYSYITLFGTGLLLLSDKKYKVPIYALFFTIGAILFLDTLMDEFFNTFYPVLLIVLFSLLCLSISSFIRHK